MLQLVIGSTAVSMGVLLGTFMGGMCLGSLALSRVISRRRHPLRVYALLELGTGILAIAVLWGMPYVNDLYTASVGHGMPGIFLRAVVCAICLLPPTLLMGATLPAISRWIETTPQGVSWMGFFYGGNIAGAVFGCLLAGFVLAEALRHGDGHLCRRGDQRRRGRGGPRPRVRHDAPRAAAGPAAGDAAPGAVVLGGLCGHRAFRALRAGGRGRFGPGCCR